MNTYIVYMLATRRGGVLYVGVTRDLFRRVQQHRDGHFSQFTRKYGIKTLVWFEVHSDIRAAIAREKTIKRWRRAWKIALIEAANPTWRDLVTDIAPA